ncbi:MAG: hypothetical protein CNLJKLNK_00264 [Holosporales bacterium]
MTLKISAVCLMAMTALFGADTAFQDVRLQKISVRNTLSESTTFELLSRYIYLPTAQDNPNGFGIVPAHGIIEAAPGAVFYGPGKDGIERAHPKTQVSNYRRSPLDVPQKHTLTLNPGETTTLELAFPHYFSGIRGAVNFEWDAVEDAVTVNVGGEGVRGSTNQNFVSTPQDLKHQLDLYKKYFMDGRDASYTEILQDFTSQGSGVLQTKRTEEVIVSLTSYPARFATTWLAIESLLRQEERPDRVNINLFEGEFPGRVLPWFIRQQMKRGLEVNWCPENLKVYLKVIPTVQKFPDAAVVATDDDVIYPKDRLHNLMDGYREHPDCVIAQDVRVIPLLKGLVLPVDFWYFTGWDVPNKSIQPAYNLVPEGYAGVIYPPRSLFPRFSDKSMFTSLCATDDDIWMFTCVNANCKKVYKISTKLTYRETVTEGTQNVESRLGNGNFRDNCFILKKYFDLISKSGLLRCLRIENVSYGLDEIASKVGSFSNKKIDISSKNNMDLFDLPVSFSSGFSYLEPDGLWQIGRKSIVKVYSNAYVGSFSVIFYGFPYLNSDQNTLEISINRNQSTLSEKILKSDNDIEIKDSFASDEKCKEYVIETNSRSYFSFFIKAVEIRLN